MSNLKDSSAQEQPSGRAKPKVSRPHIPGYGIPKSDEGLLPWSHVAERLERARNYWVGTAGADGRPHAVPVWGAWVDGGLYFGGGPRTQRNLAANPAVVVHLESGEDVVILEGVATEFTNPDPALVERVDDAFAAKYDGFRPGGGGYVLRPSIVFAWSKFPNDATRWVFGDDWTQLVDKFVEARKNFIETIDKFPPDKRDEVLFGDWNLKDMLAHFSAWDQYFSQALSLHKAGKPVDHWQDVDEFNRLEINKRKSWPWEDIYQEFIRSGHDFIAEYRDVDESTLNKAFWESLSYTYTPLVALKDNIYNYEKAHVDEITKCLQDWGIE